MRLYCTICFIPFTSLSPVENLGFWSPSCISKVASHRSFLIGLMIPLRLGLGLPGKKAQTSCSHSTGFPEVPRNEDPTG